MKTTYLAKPGEVERKWYVIDAKGQALGRLASQVAKILRGKHKPQFTPNVDTGDFVIIVNASQVKLTGHKAQQKMYVTHSHYPGGLRETPYEKMLATKPERIVEHAVKGMLPHSNLGRLMGKKLKVYRGSEHPHAAQKPESIEVVQ